MSRSSVPPLHSRTHARHLIAICVALAAPAVLSAGEEPATLGQALARGTATVDLRYRIESVKDDNPALLDDSGEASTLRATLAYRTAPFRSVSAYVQFEKVTDLGFEEDHANAGAGHLSNGLSGLPVIADPEITDVNQAYLQLDAGRKTHVRIGRQEILRGNVRFVGNVGWRQDHQSFDALSIESEAVNRTQIRYAYVRNANTITGGNAEMGSHLLDVEVDLGKPGQLTGYAYRLDYDADALSGLSTLTAGMRFAGKWDAGRPVAVKYDVELSRQSDTAGNPGSYDLDYLRADGALIWKKIEIGLGTETLEGDGAFSFRTPLATLHAWNGWADKFLATPPGGLVERRLSLRGTVAKTKLTAVYRDFSADTGGQDYGRELDLLAVYTSPWKQSFALKAALYDARDFSYDTNKIWFYTSYSFSNR